jgi:hypothetical protein
MTIQKMKVLSITRLPDHSPFLVPAELGVEPIFPLPSAQLHKAVAWWITAGGVTT